MVFSTRWDIGLIKNYHRINLSSQKCLLMRNVSNYYMSEGNAGAGLAANKTSNAGLVLHNAVRDAHFTAERRQKDDELKTKMVTIIT